LAPPPLPGPPTAPGPPAAPTAPAAANAPAAPTAAAAHSAGLSQDPDEVWRSIVEGFGREHDGPVPPWPVSEDVDRPAPPSPPGAPGTTPPGAPPANPAGPGVIERRHPDRRGRPATDSDGSIRWSPRPDAAAPGPRDSGASQDELPDWVEPGAVEDDGHYEPPPPPPVPRPALPRVLAVLGFVVGVLLMFVPGALGQPRTSGVQLFGVIVTVIATVAFVWLMRDASDDDPDGGARV